MLSPNSAVQRTVNVTPVLMCASLHQQAAASIPRQQTCKGGRQRLDAVPQLLATTRYHGFEHPRRSGVGPAINRARRGRGGGGGGGLSRQSDSC